MKKQNSNIDPLVYALAGVIFILGAVSFYYRSSNTIEVKSKSEESSNKKVVGNASSSVQTKNNSSNLKADTTSTALKLDFDLLNGNTKIFDFKDDDKFFGTNLSIKFPARMSSAPGDKKRTIRKLAILDDDHSEFRCVINFQPMNIASSTFQEKRNALNKKSIAKNLQLLGAELHHFEIIDVVEDVFVANEPASYGEYYCENLKTDGADRINSMCRNYFFFYRGGFATVQFYLDSRSLDKTEVLQSFEGYKRVINRMINSVELYN